MILHGLSQSPSWFFYCFVNWIESEPLCHSPGWQQCSSTRERHLAQAFLLPKQVSLLSHILFVLGLGPLPQLLSLEVQVLPSRGWLQCSLLGWLVISFRTLFLMFCILVGRVCWNCVPCYSLWTRYDFVDRLRFHQLYKQARLYQSCGRRALVFGIHIFLPLQSHHLQREDIFFCLWV